MPQKLQYQWHVQVPTTEPVDTPEMKLLFQKTNFLTLGGWDEDLDQKGDVVWMNTVPNQGWNQTISEFKFNDDVIISEDEQTTVVFETGYPYIGLSEKYFDKVKTQLESEIDFLNCRKGDHWGLCYVKTEVCDNVYSAFNLTFTINAVEF